MLWHKLIGALHKFSSCQLCKVGKNVIFQKGMVTDINKNSKSHRYMQIKKLYINFSISLQYASVGQTSWNLTVKDM